MEVNEKELKELKDRQVVLTNEVKQLQLQLQQVKQLAELLPVRIAERQGEIIGLNRILDRIVAMQKNKNIGKQ